MVGNNSSGKYLLSISYEKRDSVLVKQHVASHTRTILLQHNLNLNSLFPADIILEINKTSLLSKSGVSGKEHHIFLSQSDSNRLLVSSKKNSNNKQQKYRMNTRSLNGPDSEQRQDFPNIGQESRKRNPNNSILTVHVYGRGMKYKRKLWKSLKLKFSVVFQ